MLFKSNKKSKSFSLIEILITIAILSSAVVFIYRAFTASLSAARFSQNMTLASFLAEDKLWEIEESQRNKFTPPATKGEAILGNRKFTWDYEISKTDDPALTQLEFNISWPEKRTNEYIMNFFTYLLQNNEEK